MKDSPAQSGKLRRAGLRVAGVLFLLLIFGAGWFLIIFGRVAAGYAATIGAVQVFGTGDDVNRVLSERMRLPLGLGRFMSLEVVEGEARRVRARSFGVFESEAEWRPGLGATRVVEGAGELPTSIPDEVPALQDSVPWPLGESPELAPLSDSQRRGVKAAIDRIFTDEAGNSNGTHAVVLVVDGRLVAERYREGYDRHTPILGWSMTKSVTGTLIGRLIALERLAGIEMRAPVPEWSAKDDPRGEISLEELLRMRSGLEFFANYELPWADSLQMLFRSADCAGFAAQKPLAHPPGAVWSYSDGTANILARIVRDHAGDTEAERLAFPQRHLFGPLRMSTAVICVDASGTWIGSSLMLASARDWARYGQLHIDDGVFAGERLLPEGWVDFAASATPESDGRCYGGAQFWRFDEEALLDAHGDGVPPEVGGILYASGHAGQYVWMDRRRRLVLVRLGILEPGFDPMAFLTDILRLFS
jgi:CubicO group peptidase (beta-lactamase class C family)